MQQKREEDAIQQEMAKIRKDMDEEKKKNYEQKVRLVNIVQFYFKFESSYSVINIIMTLDHEK